MLLRKAICSRAFVAVASIESKPRSLANSPACFSFDSALSHWSSKALTSEIPAMTPCLAAGICAAGKGGVCSLMSARARPARTGLDRPVSWACSAWRTAARWEERSASHAGSTVRAPRMPSADKTIAACAREVPGRPARRGWTAPQRSAARDSAHEPRGSAKAACRAPTNAIEAASSAASTGRAPTTASVAELRVHSSFGSFRATAGVGPV